MVEVINILRKVSQGLINAFPLEIQQLFEHVQSLSSASLASLHASIISSDIFSKLAAQGSGGGSDNSRKFFEKYWWIILIIGGFLFIVVPLSIYVLHRNRQNRIKKARETRVQLEDKEWRKRGGGSIGDRGARSSSPPSRDKKRGGGRRKDPQNDDDDFGNDSIEIDMDEAYGGGGGGSGGKKGKSRSSSPQWSISEDDYEEEGRNGRRHKSGGGKNLADGDDTEVDDIEIGIDTDDLDKNRGKNLRKNVRKEQLKSIDAEIAKINYMRINRDAADELKPEKPEHKLFVEFLNVLVTVDIQKAIKNLSKFNSSLRTRLGLPVRDIPPIILDLLVLEEKDVTPKDMAGMRKFAYEMFLENDLLRKKNPSIIKSPTSLPSKLLSSSSQIGGNPSPPKSIQAQNVSPPHRDARLKSPQTLQKDSRDSSPSYFPPTNVRTQVSPPYLPPMEASTSPTLRSPTNTSILSGGLKGAIRFVSPTLARLNSSNVSSNNAEPPSSTFQALNAYNSSFDYNNNSNEGFGNNNNTISGATAAPVSSDRASSGPIKLKNVALSVSAITKSQNLNSNSGSASGVPQPPQMNLLTSNAIADRIRARSLSANPNPSAAASGNNGLRNDRLNIVPLGNGVSNNNNNNNSNSNNNNSNSAFMSPNTFANSNERFVKDIRNSFPSLFPQSPPQMQSQSQSNSANPPGGYEGPSNKPRAPVPSFKATASAVSTAAKLSRGSIGNNNIDNRFKSPTPTDMIRSREMLYKNNPLQGLGGQAQQQYQQQQQYTNAPSSRASLPLESSNAYSSGGGGLDTSTSYLSNMFRSTATKQPEANNNRSLSANPNTSSLSTKQTLSSAQLTQHNVQRQQELLQQQKSVRPGAPGTFDNSTKIVKASTQEQSRPASANPAVSQSYKRPLNVDKSKLPPPIAVDQSKLQAVSLQMRQGLQKSGNNNNN